MQEFDLTIPGELDEALDILASDKQAVPLAGGTDLLVDIRAGRNTPNRLVGIGNIAELRKIKVDGTGVTIGGGTTVGDLLRHPRMAERAPSVVASARVFGGQMVRNAATVAGNICNGSPSADLVPPLLSLDAQVTLASRKARRTVLLDDFLLGYKENTLRKDELLTEVFWDRTSSSSSSLFYKLAGRKGDAISIVGVAVSMTVREGKCSLARIALGSVAPTVMRAKQAEDILSGRKLTPILLEAAARQASQECAPIDDLRASAEYRCHAVHMLSRRLLTQAWDQLS